MKARVLAVLDAFDVDQNEGLDALDVLLHELLPHVTSQRKNPNARHPDLTAFIVSQDSVECNLATALVDLYKEHSEMALSSQKMLLRTNRLLQGLLLIHPPSRRVFSRKAHMGLIIGYLRLPNDEESENSVPVELTVSFISLLIHILLKNARNLRVFEDQKGYSVLMEKLLLSDTLSPGLAAPSRVAGQQDLNFKIIEFLVFYLVDENETDFRETCAGISLLSVKDKAALIRPSFDGIDDLISNLDELKTV